MRPGDAGCKGVRLSSIWLEGLDEAQLARPGIHPETGAMTILHLAINTVLHDVDHMEQISRVLGRGSLAQ